MRKTWALVMAAAMAAASLTACSSSKPAETAAPETEAEAAETEETEAEAEATGDQQEILVAAAASLQYVMEDKIQPAFEKENPDIKLSFTFDSSGKLQTQIEEGADADVFFSAAMKQMNALEDEGLVDADSVVELLENKIALIVPKDSTLGITGFEDITKAEKIALGDPESVPAGRIASTASTASLSSRRSPTTVEPRCMTCEKCSTHMYFSTFTLPILLIFPISFLPRSTSMLCSARSFSSFKSPASSSLSSSLVFPLGLVPANGKVLRFPASSFTKVSGDAPAISISSLEK